MQSQIVTYIKQVEETYIMGNDYRHESQNRSHMSFSKIKNRIEK